MFHPISTTALRINRPIINLKFFCAEYLFQIIKTETAEIRNITVTSTLVNEFGGVQRGNSIELFRSLDDSAKYDAADAVMIASNGIAR